MPQQPGADPDLEQRVRRAIWAATVALVLWPLSYAWTPFAGRNPGWVFLVVPLSEVVAVALAAWAVWTGVRARLRGDRSRDSRWVIGLGGLVLLLVVAGNLVAIALAAQQPS